VQFTELQRTYSAMPHFFIAGDKTASADVKIPAAWLIDQCGWRGRRLDTVGVHSQQALVLIHYGGGNADALLGLASDIRRDVEQRFAISLEMEPGVYGE
jgi:UDP-N-acetylmuramate dehydrogenase